MECKVRSVKCGVWSVKCGVWSGKCGVCGVRSEESAIPATQNDIIIYDNLLGNLRKGEILRLPP